MITIIIPEWVVWILMVMWFVGLAVKLVLVVVTHMNDKASHTLVRALSRLNALMQEEEP